MTGGGIARHVPEDRRLDFCLCGESWPCPNADELLYPDGAPLAAPRPDPIAALTSTPVVRDPTLPTWSSGWRPMRHDEAQRAVEALEGRG